jgi:hypothetical protein
LLVQALDVAFSLPNKTGQHRILKIWLDCLSRIAKVNADMIERRLIEVADLSSSKSYFYESSRFQSLVALGLSDKNNFFPTIRKMAVSEHKTWDKEKLSVGQTQQQNVEFKSDVPEHIVDNSACNYNQHTTFERNSNDENSIMITDNTMTSFNNDENKCSQFIQRLLQREFHYDGNGNRPSQESPECRKLRNSLDLLSASLYSSDVHFIMELVQNSDDNAYLPNVIPTIKIELFPHALLVFNNEIGFQEKNIVAVCNVGGSTKQGMAGYIGQKGIGFKSVFSISDVPEIHSNGMY